MAAEHATLRMASWQRLWRLSWSDRCLLVQAMALLPAASVAVRLVGFQRLRTALARFTPRRQAASPVGVELEVKVARHYARIVGIAARRGVVRGNCLQRSLALWWLLTRRSIPSQVHVGVRTVSGELQAHAWVEVRGQIIADRADIRQHYAAFDQPILSPSST